MKKQTKNAKKERLEDIIERGTSQETDSNRYEDSTRLVQKGLGETAGSLKTGGSC